MAQDSPRGMMEGKKLEDGELSGSDTDMEVEKAAGPNNIWGEVLQEQTQEAVANELAFMKLDGSIYMSRQSETYDYVLAQKLGAKASEEEKMDVDQELGKNEDQEHVRKEEKGHLKRKQPVKKRLGEMVYKGRFEITETDPQDKVSDEIAYRLQEPKKDLIERVVKTIGTKKAIELLMETAEVEQSGGLFVMNGTRRKTPGGVYLTLLKSTPSITSDQVKDIFYVENQKAYKSKKAAKKRTRLLRKERTEAIIEGLNSQELDDTAIEIDYCLDLEIF